MCNPGHLNMRSKTITATVTSDEGAATFAVGAWIVFETVKSFDLGPTFHAISASKIASQLWESLHTSKVVMRLYILQSRLTSVY